jgi:RNA polymerase sigma factor (sigma-70 family)
MNFENEIKYRFRKHETTGEWELIGIKYPGQKLIDLTSPEYSEQLRRELLELKKEDDKIEVRERRRAEKALDIVKQRKGYTEKQMYAMPIEAYNSARREEYKQLIPSVNRGDEVYSHVEWEVEREEHIDETRRAVEKLLPEQRELVYLRYYKEMSVTEIAKQMGVDKSAISHRLTRIHKRLRKELVA